MKPQSGILAFSMQKNESDTFAPNSSRKNGRKFKRFLEPCTELISFNTRVVCLIRESQETLTYPHHSYVTRARSLAFFLRTRTVDIGKLSFWVAMKKVSEKLLITSCRERKMKRRSVEFRCPFEGRVEGTAKFLRRFIRRRILIRF